MYISIQFNIELSENKLKIGDQILSINFVNMIELDVTATLKIINTSKYLYMEVTRKSDASQFEFKEEPKLDTSKIR